MTKYRVLKEPSKGDYILDAYIDSDYKWRHVLRREHLEEIFDILKEFKEEKNKIIGKIIYECEI